MSATTTASTSASTTTATVGGVAKKKLTGYDLYRHLGSPKYVVAPMVDQSELLIYTPMINAKMFSDSTNKSYRAANFDLISNEEGDPTTDRPLIVQFCANDPDQLLASAKLVENHCDAVDLNLGCPQDIAKRGHYGSFLQDEWDLIYKLINTLHVNLSIPVTAKFRVFPTVEKTVEYAKMLESAGAQILTCHGRLREQRGQNSGLADWAKIKAVKEAVSVPVFANGNVLFQSDIISCLETTGCDAVMSAEGQLYNPVLFRGIDLHNPLPPSSYSSDEDILVRHPHCVDVALEYLDIVLELKTNTAFSAIKGHLFKMLRPALTKETDLRAKLGQVRANPKKQSEGVEEYRKICLELKERMAADVAACTSLKDAITIDPATGIPVMPHWLLQPYFRATPEQKKVLAAAQALAKAKAESEDAAVGDKRVSEAPGADAETQEPKRPRVEVVDSEDAPASDPPSGLAIA